MYFTKRQTNALRLKQQSSKYPEAQPPQTRLAPQIQGHVSELRRNHLHRETSKVTREQVAASYLRSISNLSELVEAAKTHFTGNRVPGHTSNDGVGRTDNIKMLCVGKILASLGLHSYYNLSKSPQLNSVHWFFVFR